MVLSPDCVRCYPTHSSLRPKWSDKYFASASVCPQYPRIDEANSDPFTVWDSGPSSTLIQLLRISFESNRIGRQPTARHSHRRTTAGSGNCAGTQIAELRLTNNSGGLASDDLSVTSASRCQEAHTTAQRILSMTADRALNRLVRSPSWHHPSIAVATPAPKSPMRPRYHSLRSN